MKQENINPELNAIIQAGIERLKEGGIRRDNRYKKQVEHEAYEFTKADREWFLAIGRQAAIEYDLEQQRLIAEKSSRKALNVIATEATLF